MSDVASMIHSETCPGFSSSPGPQSLASGEPPAEGKPLAALLHGMEYRCLTELDGTLIEALTADSRQARPGALFVAVPGLRTDGHQYLQEAISRGCAAVMLEAGRSLPEVSRPLAVIEVPDTRAALGLLAAAFYDRPAENLKMIGITGTNGKTTCSYLLEAIIQAAGGKPGVLGTVSYRFDGLELPAPFTTPEPVMLQQILRQMQEAGVTHVVMEVSSHALAQKRLAGVAFDLALFTNLTRDHLDFHGEMADYYESKKKLFLEHLTPQGRAVVLTKGAADCAVPDSGWCRRLVNELVSSTAWQQTGRGKEKVITCGVDPQSEVAANNYSFGLGGLQTELETPAGAFSLSAPLVGRFNLDNVLVAVGAAVALGLPKEAVQQGLSTVTTAPGRMERVICKAGVEVYVDYAHTPDALENVLHTLRDLQPHRLILLFGCGGDRDRGKRPEMGEIAARLADVVLITSDNPRSEEPQAILADIERGLVQSSANRLGRQRAEILLKGHQRRGYDVIESRREAIGLAMSYSQPGDVILISGKGHEDYQITRAGKQFFDDRKEARRHAMVIQ